MKGAKSIRYSILRKAILVAVVGMCLSENTFAQKLSDTISIEEVQVFGQRKLEEAGLVVAHIDTLALQMMKTQTVSELLTSYSPVFIKSYGRGSVATASFRGTAPSHTQVYWNGIKINSPMQGNVDFALVPVYFIDDVSLQNGGASLQSGSGALGGTVLLNNKPDWNDRFSIRYVQTLESFSTQKEYLNIGFGNRRLQSKTRVFSDHSQNDFPFYNYGVLPMRSDVQKNADYTKYGLLQELYLRAGRHLFSAKIWAYKSDRNLPQLMSFEGENRKETQHDENLRAVLGWKQVMRKGVLEWIGGINYTRLNYFRSSNEANFVNFDSRSKEKSLINQFNFNWKPTDNLSFNWELNGSYHQVSVFDRAQQLGYDRDRLEVSLLNAVHYRPWPKAAFSYINRNELYDSQLTAFIQSLAFEYFLNEKEQSLKLNVSRNYHQPGLNDLFWLPGGNPDLNPEDGFLSDLTYSIDRKSEHFSWSGQASAYWSLIDNWIAWLPSRNGAYYWEATNLRKVLARGAEVQASLHFQSAKAFSFDLKGNYSYSATSNIDAVSSVDKSRGKQLIYIPKHKANVFAETNWKDYFLKINAPFTGKRYTSSNNEASDYEKVLNPYWLVNLMAGRNLDLKPFHLNLSLTIENLFDTDYMAVLWRAMPGRYYSFTAQISYRK